MMLPEASKLPRPGLHGYARMVFALTLFVFVAWVIGLGVMAFTTAEKPRSVALPAAALPR
jgi:hypothetical protein